MRRLRSGLTCLATLSHSARSSSLRPRLRRGGSGNSGIESGRRRFIDDGDIGAGDAEPVLSKPLQPWAAARAAAPASPRQPGPPELAKQPRPMKAVQPRAGCWSPRSPRAAAQRSCSTARFAGTALRFSPTAAHPAPAACGRAPIGSRLFGTSMTKRALWRSRPATLPASSTGAEIEIGARGTDDGRAGVLRDHQPPKRRL